jgi:hypothetical protein
MDEIERGYWVIANHKHLLTFSEEAHNRDEYEATDIAGKAGIFLAQIRGQGRIPFKNIVKSAKKARIPRVILVDTILPKLRNVTDGRIDFDKDLTEVEEHIDTEATLFEATGVLHKSLGPSDIDTGSIETLSYTSPMPRNETEITTKLTKMGMNEEEAIACLSVQDDFELVKVYRHHGLSEPIFFNEYIWRCDPQKIAFAISKLEAAQKRAIEQIVEICEGHQGYPSELFMKEENIINLADSVGLIDVVDIQSADGITKPFIFTPHLRSEENPTSLSNDLLGDIKLFLASIGFGERYSKISRLGDVGREKTINFVKRLIREGEAGDATPIGIDYIMLEERGIIKIAPTATPPGGRHKMILLRPEVARLALRAIETSSTLEKKGLLPLSGFLPKNLRQGKHFTDVEGRRIKEKPYAKLPQETEESRNYYLKKLRGEL